MFAAGSHVLCITEVSMCRILSFLAVLHCSLGSRELLLHRFKDYESRGLVCNDGSGGGYYILPAPEGASTTAQNRWIFHLEGGGWCYDNSTCSSRITNNGYGTGNLVSSKNWPNTVKVSGIFEMSDEDWYNANLVHIPYCSSDAHMGDSDHQVEGWGLQHFRGRRLARQAVKELVQEKEGQEVLFGGTSAGGRGSMVLIDYLREVLGPNTRLLGVHDSGAYQDIPVFDASYTPFGEQCRRAYKLYHPRISQPCLDAFLNETWKCVCGEYILPRLETPSQVLIYLYDSYQLSNAVGSSPEDWNLEMCRYAEDLFRPGMEATAREVAETSQHVVFGPACYRHGIMTTSQFQSIKVQGLSAETQLLQWLGGLKNDVWSTCSGVNCQDSCPSYSSGGLISILQQILGVFT